MDASDVYFEGDDTQFQEIAPSVNPKYGAVLPQMVPTPDVIIEEIIEEDESELCFWINVTVRPYSLRF